MPLEGRADFAVLAALEEYGSLSQADLGRRLGLDRNEINGIVGRLVVGSHVDRQTDPSDRRRNTVTITPEGVRRLDELEKIAHDVQSELLKGLDESERQQLRSLLDRVLASHGPQKS
jgi:DNA-binding MarR family transcriptional regulator